MAKNKQQQKKKERERRVAQKKLAEAEKRAQEQTDKGTETASPRAKTLMAAVPAQKPDYVAAKAKSSFIRRRSMG